MSDETPLPTYFIPHGGGPWPFIPDLAGAYGSLKRFLKGLLLDVGRTPSAIVIVSGHWEEPVPTVSARPDYSMLYDYSGFPAETYRLRYPAPGSPEIAGRVSEALDAAGIAVATERVRGYDHGAFVPLMIAAPEATIPIVPLSLVGTLDPRQHIALGRALAPLRDENILIVGSGMSFHNIRALLSGGSLERASTFDAWLHDAVTSDPAEREQRLTAWASAPEARFAHPREEHLLPLMVAAGAGAGDRARRVYSDPIMGAAASGFRFG